MLFSIYDYKNMLLDGKGKEEAIYVGTTAAETAYGYMKPGGGKPGGGEISLPYFVEFRITETEPVGGAGPDKDNPKPITLAVLGAEAATDAKGVPQFKADGSPEDAGLVYHEVGRLVIAEPDLDEPLSYRVAVSSNKHKWFKAEVENGNASAFLMRG